MLIFDAGANKGKFTDEYLSTLGNLENLSVVQIEANEQPVINGDGSQAYDFIYVEDVARCNVAALKSSVNFGMYNVGTEVQTSIKELCDLILDMKKSELKVQYKPYSADDARSLVQNRIGSRLKAENELGFLFKYSLREGLEKLIDWRIVTGVDKKIL